MAARRYGEDREAGERQLGEAPDSGLVGPTLEQWWERWLPAQDLASSTLESYAQQYRHYLRPLWGSTPVGRISSLQVARFEKDLRECGLTSSSVTVVMTVLRDLLVDAAAEHLIPAPPAFRTGRRRRRTPDDRRPGMVIDLPMLQAIRARLPRDASLLVLTAAFTGMRWGELCGMRRAFLTLEPEAGKRLASGCYEVDPLVGAAHEDVHSRRYFGPPKGGHGRLVDLPPFLVKRLLRHIERMGERDLLFPDTHGRLRRHTDWLYLWRPACNGRPEQLAPDGRVRAPAVPALCPGLRLQDLRHTHKTMLIELGVPEVLQIERLGHQAAGVSALYAHSTPAMHAQLTAALQQLWHQGYRHQS